MLQDTTAAVGPQRSRHAGPGSGEVGMKHHKLTRDPRNGKYYARIQVDGVIKKFYFGKNQRKADQELRELEADIESGTRSLAAMANAKVDKSDPQDTTIEDLVTRYLEWVESNRERGTYLNKKLLLQPFLDRYGECMVSDINHSTLAKYYAWAKKYRGRSANGGNRHMREVKTVFRWGEDMDICLCPVRRFPVMRESPAKTRKFTDDELPLLVQHSQPDFRDMLVFGLLTGLRPQELRALRKEDIRQVGNATCIVFEKHKATMAMQLQQPRVVPLSQLAVEIVQRQTEKHAYSAHIFLNGNGKPYKAGGFRQKLERVCDRAGIERRSPYALRHYFGTKRAGEGLNQAILAQVMGHTTIVTTTRYVAKVPKYQQEAMNAMASDLAALLGQTEQPPPEEPEEGQTLRFPIRKIS